MAIHSLNTHQSPWPTQALLSVSYCCLTNHPTAWLFIAAKKKLYLLAVLCVSSLVSAQLVGPLLVLPGVILESPLSVDGLGLDGHRWACCPV